MNTKLVNFYANSCPNLTEIDLSTCPNLKDISFAETPLHVLAIPWMENSFSVRLGNENKSDETNELTVRRFPGSTATVIARNTKVTYVDDLK